MLIVIVGKSNSGKTTFANKIKEKTNIEGVVTCTTRPPRKNEIDGVDYHFIKYNDAYKQIWKGDFIEYTQYNVANKDIWLYGTRYKDIDINKLQIIVTNPEGLRALKDKFGNNIISILIKPNSIKRIMRILKRDKGNYKEAFRRYIADYKDFKGLKTDIIIKDFKL